MVEHVESNEDIVEIRHNLHAHPELGFHEVNTSAYVAQLLKEHGIDIVTSTLSTGVVATISGSLPGPRIALRADIDGLPIVENTGLPYSSLNPGVMHGCGHDFHMAGLLSAAFWLAEHRDRVAGTVVLLFQPAEETGLGAKSVVDSGALGNLDAIIGLHNNPDYRPGELAVGIEPMMAGCVRFSVTLHAQGTHAGYPHMGTGPIEALSAMVLSLQTIVSRNASPFHALVLSVTELHGGHVWNVVPAEAGFMGTVRYFHQEDGAMVQQRFQEVVKSTAAAYGISADISWEDIAGPLVSDAALAEAVARDVPQYAVLKEIQPSMAGEDFYEYGSLCPMVFAFVGSNGEPGHHDWHSPQFIGLDSSINTAAEFYVNATLRVIERLKAA